jgi:hypothetical protein
MDDLAVVGSGDELEHGLEGGTGFVGPAGDGVQERDRAQRGVFEQAVVERAGVGERFGRERRGLLQTQVDELKVRQRHPQLEADGRNAARLVGERGADAPPRLRERASRPPLDRGPAADQRGALRCYLPPEDVRVALQPSPTRTRCPYKGEAAYWSVDLDGRTIEDLAWSYERPNDEAARIAGLVCFFNERVDVILDGERAPRPRTPWSEG